MLKSHFEVIARVLGTPFPFHFQIFICNSGVSKSGFVIEFDESSTHRGDSLFYSLPSFGRLHTYIAPPEVRFYWACVSLSGELGFSPLRGVFESDDLVRNLPSSLRRRVESVRNFGSATNTSGIRSFFPKQTNVRHRVSFDKAAGQNLFFIIESSQPLADNDKIDLLSLRITGGKGWESLSVATFATSTSVLRSKMRRPVEGGIFLVELVQYEWEAPTQAFPLHQMLPGVRTKPLVSIVGTIVLPSFGMKTHGVVVFY